MSQLKLLNEVSEDAATSALLRYVENMSPIERAALSYVVTELYEVRIGVTAWRFGISWTHEDPALQENEEFEGYPIRYLAPTQFQFAMSARQLESNATRQVA